jgi:endonuclease III
VRTTGSFTNKYRVRFGYTPFPQNTRPSQKLCYAVFDALKEHHERDDIRLERYPVEKEISSNSEVQGPMHAVEEVSFHNIVKTILSQATNNDNAQTVEQTLIDRFRYNFLGVKVKGQSPNYHAMRRVEEPVIARALASGGLHNIKAKQILGCLNHVYNWNMARATDEQQIGAENPGESADFVPGMLSIDYMMPMSLQEKFDHLVSMPGIGVKTAACILSFNFEYPVFAVDTHVFRLSRMLCWLPLNARHEDYAFMHLDKRIPDELKYGLHQAFWHHGQICVRCKKGTDENTKGWKETKCPIDRFVNRSRKDPVTSKRPKPKRDEKKGELKKAKTRPTVYPHSKLTPQEAAELGYELRTIMIDDGFGVRRANFKGKPLLKWVLKSDHVAIGDTDRQATTEDIKNEIEDPEEVDENIPDAEMDEFAASADDLLDEDTDDVAAEVDVVEEDDLSDEDFDIEEV